MNKPTDRVAKHRASRRPLYVNLAKPAAKALERGRREHGGNATAAVQHALETTYPEPAAGTRPNPKGKK